MDTRVGVDMERYRGALEATGGAFGGVEPISRFHEAFRGPVDAAYAAAVVGLETETFLEKVRENTGLQNVGLLVLEGENGSVKRDAWTSSFRDVISALDYPQQVGEPPVITQPEVIPGGQVHIPDSNLRTAIAEELGKSVNAPITAEDMKRLTLLDVRNKDIHDLTGLQFATNLWRLVFDDNPVADLSPIVGLINLRYLAFDRINQSGGAVDLSPIAGLSNLEDLNLPDAVDLSPLAGLSNLRILFVSGHHDSISDLSPLAGLVNLELIHAGGISVSDLSPLAGLTKLSHLYLPNAMISDLTPLVGLTGLEELYLFGNDVTDISLLARLTDLKRLDLSRTDLSDISPLAGISNLKWLNLHNNKISDISALSGLTNLTWLDVSVNEISNLSPLDGIRPNLNFIRVTGNPYFPPGGTDLLSEASGGTVTELTVATHGATAGQAVGDSMWTLNTLPHQRANNIGDMLKDSLRDGAIYGSLSLYSPREQATMIYNDICWQRGFGKGLAQRGFGSPDYRLACG